MKYNAWQDPDGYDWTSDFSDLADAVKEVLMALKGLIRPLRVLQDP